MSTVEILALTIIVVVVLVWRITWLATRVHRATCVRNAPGRCLMPLWWDALSAPPSSS